MSGVRVTAVVLVMCGLLIASSSSTRSQMTVPLVMRGRQQTVRAYGTRGGVPVIISSGDGGWIHLAPHVADVLAGRGFFVVGFDVRAYLASFTTDTVTLRADEEPGDYRVLIDFAAGGAAARPILIGVSEGAGLSVLAAADPHNKPAISGVLALGLPDLNELGWRWRDAVIYLTHDTPKEPTFSAAAIVNDVAPVPLGAIHSTRDEFVPVAEVQRVFDHARQPKKLWLVPAADHRFSDNLAGFDSSLLDAIDWIARHGAT